MVLSHVLILSVIVHNQQSSVAYSVEAVVPAVCQALQHWGVSVLVPLPGIVHSAAMNEIADQHQLKCVAIFCTGVPLLQVLLRSLSKFKTNPVLLWQCLAALQPLCFGAAYDFMLPVGQPAASFITSDVCSFFQE